MRVRGWWRGAIAALAALILNLPAQATWAAPLLQEAGEDNSRMEVILITTGVVLAALLLCAVGYMYRRALGLRRVPPVTLLEPGKKITGD